MKKSLWIILAFATGLLPGFFLIFNFMFTDVASPYERGLSFLVVITAYLILGAAFGLAGRESGWVQGVWISLPALLLVLIYSFKESGTILIYLLYGTAALASSVTGGYLGSKLSGKRKQ